MRAVKCVDPWPRGAATVQAHHNRGVSVCILYLVSVSKTMDNGRKAVRRVMRHHGPPTDRCLCCIVCFKKLNLLYIYILYVVCIEIETFYLVLGYLK